MSQLPNIYHFNASCEMAVANGTNSFTPPAFIQRFEQELELLPLYLANPEDILLVKKNPSEAFQERLAHLMPHSAKTKTFEELNLCISDNNPVNNLLPWGWSPAEHRLLNPFKAHCSSNFKEQPNAQWKPDHKELYSRKTALGILKQFINHTKYSELFIDKDKQPCIATSLEDIEKLQQKWNALVIKAPWSSSGRGLIILKHEKIDNTYFKWIKGSIAKQGYVMVEPYFNKILDLSFHYEIKAKSSIKHLGNASFNTNEGGQYIGNNIQHLPESLTPKQRAFLSSDLFKEINQQLIEGIKNSVLFDNYHGVLGVDALFYTDAIGAFKINPCMEINLRQNMGTLALKIRQLLHPKAKGIWQVKYFTGKQTHQAFEFDTSMQKKHPLIYSEGSIIKGYLPLLEPYEHRNFAVYLLAK